MVQTFLKTMGTLALLIGPATGASAQLWRGGGASTVQGDILRGEGFFLVGAGYYNFNTARANSINTDTMIRWNEYVAAVAKNERRENAQHRAELIARKNENYQKILQRIRDNPEERDLERGDALNAELEKLLDPSISPSSFRVSPVTLPGGTIRRIPFFYGPEDATFSMQRLSVKGKWPVGFRGEEFARERRNYELAIDAALEQQIEGKLAKETIARVERAVNELGEKLDQVIPPSKDRIYIEAKNFLRKLETSKELFKRRSIEQILGEIDKYSGLDVHDLIAFMQKYNLRFGVPELGDERKLYPELYAALVLQRQTVMIGGERSSK